MEGLDRATVNRIVRAALEEDAAQDDATVDFVGVAQRDIRAEVRVGEDAVIAGIPVATAVFEELDAGVNVSPVARDGARVASGSTILQVSGKARAILSGERVALNFLQRLCGVATLSAAFVERVKGSGITILDTRKTTPLWRDLEKYAVRCGGGGNHRRDLSDAVLIKENHIAAMGGREALIACLEQVRSGGNMFVEVEVDSLEFFEAMLGVDVDRVMLDNFTPARVRHALDRMSARPGPRPFELEVSGGIDLDNVIDYALPGVDFISVGALTHSAPSITMSLEVV